MPVEPDALGGRLPLLDPEALSSEQRATYDRINATMVPWADRAEFQSKTTGGRLIGPFNPVLLNPGITDRFLDLQEAEAKHTSLDERVRQVVILAVGAVWRSSYELYAHAAVAHKAGLGEAAIRTLVAGGLPDDLSDREKIAQRYTRQLAAEHRVDPALYAAAEEAFGRQGLVDIAYLAGIYHLVCGLLNGFEIPAPDPGPKSEIRLRRGRPNPLGSGTTHLNGDGHAVSKHPTGQTHHGRYFPPALLPRKHGDAGGPLDPRDRHEP